MKKTLLPVRLSFLLASITALLTIGFTLSVIEFVGETATRQIETEIGNSLKELAFQTTDKLDRGMFERYREVQLMAERHEFGDAKVSATTRRSLLEGMQRTYPEYAWIGVTDNAGKVLVATGGMLEGADVSARPWFGNAYRGNHLTDVHQAVLLAKLLPNPTNEPKRFFDVAFPYADARGGVAGVLGVHLSWRWAKEIEDSVLLPLRKRKRLDAIITDKDGAVLLGPDELRDVTLQLASIATARETGTGFTVERWPDGKRYLVGYSKSSGYRNYPGFGWTVLVRQDLDEAYAPVHQLEKSLLIGGVAAAFAFSLLVFWAIRWLTAPLKSIARAAEDIEAGRAKTLPAVSGRLLEINSLSGSLDSLLKKLALKEKQQQELNATLEQRVEQRTAELAAMVTAVQTSERHVRAIIDTALDAFVAADSSGRITEWNPQAEAIFGWTRAEALGKSMAATIVPPRFRERYESDMARLLRTTGAGEIGKRLQLHGVRRNGEEFPAEMTIGLVETDGGHFFATFVQDISVRKNAEDDLVRERTLLNAVLETVDVGIVACDDKGTLTLFNRAAREFHGVPAKAVTADAWASEYDLFANDGQTPLRSDQVPLFRALRGEVVDNVEMTIVPKSRPRKFLLASGQPLISRQGDQLGAVVAMKDVTPLKELERLRADNERRLRAITESLPALIGQIDRDERFMFLNSRGAALFGKTEAELVGQTLRSAYGARQYAKFKPYIDLAMSGKKAVFEDEVARDGATRHFQCIYIPNRDEHGAVNGLYAMAFDITDRKNSELRQAESEERLRMITDNLPALIGYIDRDEVYRFANAPHETWFDIPASEMVGRKMADVMGPDAYARAKSYLKHNLAGERVRFEIEIPVHGETRIAEVVGIPDFRAGAVHGAYVMTTDITAIKQQEQQLQRLARQDMLTGLANRRSFQERLAEAALRAGRSGQRITVMVLDVDHFKQVNDSLGHAGGDEVLKEFSQRLKGCVRATDTVARLAGDEFTIILEGIKDAEDGQLVAQKIIQSMQLPFSVQGRQINVTTSIGIACSDASPVDVDALLKKADDALYIAKGAGRNGFHVDETRSESGIAG